VFNRGRIERVGSPAALYDDPGTLFVANFLGEANVFAGRMLDAQTYGWHEEKWRVNTAPSAEDAALIVRPERVSLIADGPVPAGHNAAPATVVDVSHLGASCRVDLDLGGGALGCAVLPATSASSVRPGHEVQAAWEIHAQAFVTEQPAESSA
jgi:ABC-type Fe3+/spermidine/putrescine transport system ATPase subunit